MVVVAGAPQPNGKDSFLVEVVDASIIRHRDDVRPGGTGVGRGTIALKREGNAWLVDFDLEPRGGDPFRPTLYASALRLRT